MKSGRLKCIMKTPNVYKVYASHHIKVRTKTGDMNSTLITTTTTIILTFTQPSFKCNKLLTQI